MTEAEWLAASDVGELIEHLWERKASTARLPAFVASFADTGRVGPLLPDELRGAFAAYVRWAREGGPHPSGAYPSFRSRNWMQGIDSWDASDTVGILVAGGGTGSSWSFVVPIALAEAHGRRQGSSFDRPDAESRELLRGQADRLRDILGNPFRPVVFSPEWRTSTTVALAQGMYDARDLSAMPILADALQDAGCDSDDILDHCRGPGPHVRGCWVVDLVLGKA